MDLNRPENPNKSPLIELTDVSVRRAGDVILDGVTLRADERRIAIVGRNGSGKTTLARVLAGLQATDGGAVKIAGKDLIKDRREAIRTVGIIFQNPDHQIIFPTVGEEIGFGLKQLGLDPSDIDARRNEILARFNVATWIDRPVQALSQGQKQLVCLMSVLAMRPRLILLDEPYSGLDIPTRMQMQRYIDGIEAHIVQITHDPDQVARFDRVIWLDDGRIRMDGAADTVLSAFREQMTAWGGDDYSDLAR